MRVWVPAALRSHPSTLVSPLHTCLSHDLHVTTDTVLSPETNPLHEHELCSVCTIMDHILYNLLTAVIN